MVMNPECADPVHGSRRRLVRPGQRTGPRQKASSTATTCWSQGAAKHQPLLSIVKHLLCMYSTHVTRRLLYDREPMTLDLQFVLARVDRRWCECCVHPPGWCGVRPAGSWWPQLVRSRSHSTSSSCPRLTAVTPHLATALLAPAPAPAPSPHLALAVVRVRVLLCSPGSVHTL